jgi:type VI protein secretion system component VasK
MLLQIILAVSVATITVFLVMLLIQARRTAASVQHFADSAAQDLHLVANDVHEVRMRVEEVSQWARSTLEKHSFLTQVVAGIVRGLPGSFGRRANSERILQALLTGLQSVVHLFHGRKVERPEEASHE